jgi:hypothetical protein
MKVTSLCVCVAAAATGAAPTHVQSGVQYKAHDMCVGQGSHGGIGWLSGQQHQGGHVARRRT